jgi:hypothetical protein
MHWKKAITPYVVIFSKKELNNLEKDFNHNTKPELVKGNSQAQLLRSKFSK